MSKQLRRSGLSCVGRLPGPMAMALVLLLAACAACAVAAAPGAHQWTGVAGGAQYSVLLSEWHAAGASLSIYSLLQ